jgi:hypothetical protein
MGKAQIWTGDRIVKKYASLITLYAQDAEAIRGLDLERKAAAAKLNEFWEQVGSSDTWNFDEERHLSAAWQAVDEAYNIDLDVLRQDVEIEYHDVPYSAPRKAGIERVMDGLGF